MTMLTPTKKVVVFAVLLATCFIITTTAQEDSPNKAPPPPLHNGLCNDEFCACMVVYQVTEFEINDEDWTPTCPDWMKTTFDDGPYESISSVTCLPTATTGIGVMVCDASQNSFFNEYGNTALNCVLNDANDFLSASGEEEGYWTGYENAQNATIGIVTSYIVRDGADNPLGGGLGEDGTIAPIIVNYQHGINPMPICPYEQPFTNTPTMSPTITASPTKTPTIDSSAAAALRDGRYTIGNLIFMMMFTSLLMLGSTALA